MLKQTRAELATGAVCIAISSVGLAQLASQPAGRNMGGDLGPTFLPTALLYILVFLGVVLILRGSYQIWRGMRSDERLASADVDTVTQCDQSPTLVAGFMPLFLLVALIGCVFLISHWGFEAPAAAFILICSLMIHRLKTGGLTWRAFAFRALETVVFVAALSLLFRTILKVPLP